MSKPIYEIHERISTALSARNMKQQDLVDKTGIPKPSISQYISGYAKPKADRVHLLAIALNVSEPWLLGYDVPMNKSDDPTDGVTNLIYPSAKPIPILGTICAGNGVWCEDNFEGMFYVDKSVKADLCLRVRGDSMIEAGINDGDYAFIRKDYSFINGGIYAVRINSDCEAVLKKVNIQGQTVMLSPCNREYEPIIDTCDNVSIIGECVGSYHIMK